MQVTKEMKGPNVWFCNRATLN